MIKLSILSGVLTLALFNAQAIKVGEEENTDTVASALQKPLAESTTHTAQRPSTSTQDMVAAAKAMSNLFEQSSLDTLVSTQPKSDVIAMLENLPEMLRDYVINTADWRSAILSTLSQIPKEKTIRSYREYLPLHQAFKDMRICLSDEEHEEFISALKYLTLARINNILQKEINPSLAAQRALFNVWKKWDTEWYNFTFENYMKHVLSVRDASFGIRVPTTPDTVVYLYDGMILPSKGLFDEIGRFESITLNGSDVFDLSPISGVKKLRELNIFHCRNLFESMRGEDPEAAALRIANNKQIIEQFKAMGTIVGDQ